MCEDDRLLNFLRRCQRDHDKPMQHSFWINIKHGRAYVFCTEKKVIVDVFSNRESYAKYRGTDLAAAKLLEDLGAEYDSIDM